MSSFQIRLSLLLAVACCDSGRAQQNTFYGQRPQAMNVPQQPAPTGNWLSRNLPWNKTKEPERVSEVEFREVPADQKLQGQYSMARLVERRGDPEQARMLYEGIIRRSPNSSGPFHRLGVLSANRGDIAAAGKLLQRAYQLDPQNAEILRDLGYLYHTQKDYVSAEKVYVRALEIEPRHEAVNNNYAMLLAEQERYEESLAQFKKVNKPAEAHANMAFFLAQTGHLDKAMEYYNHALNLDSSLKPAAEGLVQCRKLMQHLAAARQKELKKAAAGDAGGDLAGGPAGEKPAAGQPSELASMSRQRPASPAARTAGAAAGPQRISLSDEGEGSAKNDRSGTNAKSAANSAPPEPVTAAPNPVRVASTSSANDSTETIAKATFETRSASPRPNTPIHDESKIFQRYSRQPASPDRGSGEPIDVSRRVAVEDASTPQSDPKSEPSARQSSLQLKDSPTPQAKSDRPDNRPDKSVEAQGSRGKAPVTFQAPPLGIGFNQFQSTRNTSDRFPTARPTWTPSETPPPPAATVQP